MRNIFAAVSHKGGTGRSVTVANVAYRLALKKLDICCVDLDLTSPTLGSVFGMGKYQAGAANKGQQVAPISVFDLLNRDNDGTIVLNQWENSLVDIWTQTSEDLEEPAIKPRFMLLPGLANADMRQLDLGRLQDLLKRLSESFDIVFLDVRSGNSEIADRLLSADCDEHINCWLIHFRWTRQHLAGVGNYVESFLRDTAKRFKGRLFLVSTAFPPSFDRAGPGLQSLLVEYNKGLETRLEELLRRLGFEGERPLGPVPFEELLLWKETVITRDMVERHIAQDATAKGFEQITEWVEARFRDCAT